MALLKSEVLSLIETHSDEEIDKAFGLSMALKSASLSDPEAYGDGLTGAKALYTSYQDFFTIYKDLLKRTEVSSFADLGAGIARSKLLFDHLRAPFHTFSYEFVPERVAVTREAYQGLPHPEGICETDLKEQALPDHDAYFLYLPVGPTLDHILEGLKRLSLSKERYLYVIESHGDLIPYLKKSLSSLEERETLPLKSTRHDPKLYVFRLKSATHQLKREDELVREASLSMEKGFSLKGLKDFELYALFRAFAHDPFMQIEVEDDSFNWLASLESWREGPLPESIETLYPPRIIKHQQLARLLKAAPSLRPFILERKDESIPSLMRLRKIILKDKILLEYANGKIVEKKRGP